MDQPRPRDLFRTHYYIIMRSVTIGTRLRTESQSQSRMRHVIWRTISKTRPGTCWTERRQALANLTQILRILTGKCDLWDNVVWHGTLRSVFQMHIQCQVSLLSKIFCFLFIIMTQPQSNCRAATPWNRCPSLRWTQWLKINDSFMQQQR